MCDGYFYILTYLGQGMWENWVKYHFCMHPWGCSWETIAFGLMTEESWYSLPMWVGVPQGIKNLSAAKRQKKTEFVLCPTTRVELQSSPAWGAPGSQAFRPGKYNIGSLALGPSNYTTDSPGSPHGRQQMMEHLSLYSQWANMRINLFVYCSLPIALFLWEP